MKMSPEHSFIYLGNTYLKFLLKYKKSNRENNIMTFGRKLKSLRLGKNLTQLQLAEKLDTSKSNISKYESDIIEPNLKTLALISSIFNVSIDYLITENNITYNFHPHQTSDTPTWNEILNYYPNAIQVSSEIKDLINYYSELSIKDKRWIIGQIIDLIKKQDEV